jgi:hypothetical protein
MRSPMQRNCREWKSYTKNNARMRPNNSRSFCQISKSLESKFLAAEFFSEFPVSEWLNLAHLFIIIRFHE